MKRIALPAVFGRGSGIPDFSTFFSAGSACSWRVCQLSTAGVSEGVAKGGSAHKDATGPKDPRHNMKTKMKYRRSIYSLSFKKLFKTPFVSIAGLGELD